MGELPSEGLSDLGRLVSASYPQPFCSRRKEAGAQRGSNKNFRSQLLRGTVGHGSGRSFSSALPLLCVLGESPALSELGISHRSSEDKAVMANVAKVSSELRAC